MSSGRSKLGYTPSASIKSDLSSHAKSNAAANANRPLRLRVQGSS